LGPLRRKKEHFRPAIDTIGVQHELTDGLPQRSPTGLPHLHDIVAPGAEPGGQGGRQSRLAAAIATFQRNISVVTGGFTCHCE
jgi:hypothetical protein